MFEIKKFKIKNEKKKQQKSNVNLKENNISPHMCCMGQFGIVHTKMSWTDKGLMI